MDKESGTSITRSSRFHPGVHCYILDTLLGDFDFKSIIYVVGVLSHSTAATALPVACTSSAAIVFVWSECARSADGLRNWARIRGLFTRSGVDA
jgi:hypothetical protein